MIGAKPLHISFVKVDWFITVYDEIRYLVLFGLENYDAICNKIRYLIGVKSGITYIFFQNYARIKVHSFDSLPLEDTLTFHSDIFHTFL